MATNHDTGPDPFIPAWLDELPLNPREFRVLAHLWRRGETFSTADTIARLCRMKRATVFAALKVLEAATLIRREARAGRTTLVRPVSRSGTGVVPRTAQHPWPQTAHKGYPLKGTPLRNSPPRKVLNLGKRWPPMAS